MTFASAPSTIPPMSKRFYVTTAIDYANGQPHLGHAYRHCRCRTRAARDGRGSFFLTGLDEHNEIQRAAIAEGKTPQRSVLRRHPVQHGRKFDVVKLGLSRTTTLCAPPNLATKRLVQTVAFRLHAEEANVTAPAAKGILFARHQKLHMTEERLTPTRIRSNTYGKIIRLEEENYYFKLGEHQDWRDWVSRSSSEFIMPKFPAPTMSS